MGVRGGHACFCGGCLLTYVHVPVQWQGFLFLPNSIVQPCGAVCHSVELPSLCRLVVSVTDYGIRVLAMPGGQVLHHLKLHTGEGGLMFVTGLL